MPLSFQENYTQILESLSEISLDPRYEYEYFRGVSEEDLKEIQRLGHLLPSTDRITDDPEVLEQVFGSDYYEMTERQLKSTLKGMIPWYDGKENSLKDTVNLTKRFDNALGYGDYVIAVTIEPSYQVTDLDKVYAVASPSKNVKVRAIYDVKNRRWI
jgi:hypothetical protein